MKYNITFEKIADKGTYHIGSDSYAFRLISIKKRNALVEIDGFDVRAIYKNKRNNWVNKGKDERSGKYVFGKATTELDPNF